MTGKEEKEEREREKATQLYQREVEPSRVKVVQRTMNQSELTDQHNGYMGHVLK